MKLVECVPNFSEGRRRAVIDAIVAAAKSSNVKVLDIESDADHNRSVLTFAGTPDAVKEAALAVGGKAVELIDLNKHEGQHPRMGALDVVPFVPISDVTMEECVLLAKTFAEEYATQFHVPVYLYEEAATRPDRRNLADVRKGEFEGLKDEVGRNPERVPDFGPNTIHPTAGATAVGARQVLIAYNVNLGTNNLDVAKKIAKQVRGRDGGLPAVKALGFELRDRSMVQVSMNMVNYKQSQLFEAFEMVKKLAGQSGVPVHNSEIVGLVPMEALVDIAAFYLQIQGFNPDQVLERKLMEKLDQGFLSADLKSFAADVASDRPVPGGGSVSAYTASLAAGLIAMVSRLTLKNAKYQQFTDKATQTLRQAENLQKQLLSLVDEDADAFSNVIRAYQMPKDSEAEKQARSQAIQAGLRVAAEVPMQTADAASAVLGLGKSLAEFGTENALSDIETSSHLACGAALGALSNVEINLGSIKDEDYKKHAAAKSAEIRKSVELNKNQALDTLSARKKK